MSLKKNIFAAGLCVAVLFTSVSASATTYISTTLTGKSAESGFKKLGSGTRYLKGTGKYGKGTAYAVEIIKAWPDKAKATISLSNGKSKSAKFKAKKTNKSGENQSYYIRWRGSSSKAKASLKLTN
jgi:hypothetical protein